MGYNPTRNYWIYCPETDLPTAKSRSFAISSLMRPAGVLKMLSDFRRNLMIRHLVNCLHAHDVSYKIAFLSRFFSSPLASPGPNIRIASASRMHATTAS